MDNDNSSETLSVGIDQPYRDCYRAGYDAPKYKRNPHPITQLGKRCAWAGGHNDKWSVTI